MRYPTVPSYVESRCIHLHCGWQRSGGIVKIDFAGVGYKNSWMDELPMPSQVRATGPRAEANTPDLIEPPSVKLIVRLFLIPLLIVAAAVGVMFLIGLLAGREPTLEEAVARLKAPGGERTSNYLVGPASKQRYLDAKTLVDKMKASEGMTEAERIALASQLIDIVDNHTQAAEGEVQHFILLALGRTWQKNPAQPALNSPQAIESRNQVVATLLKYADAPELATRKAAVLATVYLAGQDETSAIIPKIIEKLKDPKEDLDVRIAAATVLGPLSDSSNQPVIEALNLAMRNSDPRESELVWSATLSLAELNQTEVADTILKLLDRKELAQLQYYDRESDPKNPKFRNLSDQEEQRILINTMLGARKLQVSAVQEQLKKLTETDPSSRVREAGRELFQQDEKATK
ncbi:MAG TPA: hypothetical protein VHD56_03680 [Tepidisphaeraceae bacterium]|nr:hypothetical protein [Tepidisphaeraceae bacterium]